MKTDKEIKERYNAAIDFYGDNWVCAFEEMIYYRQMIEKAKFFVGRHAGAPVANEWLEQYENLVKTEDENDAVT